jgi:hypothetical protein
MAWLARDVFILKKISADFVETYAVAGTGGALGNTGKGEMLTRFDRCIILAAGV